MMTIWSKRLLLIAAAFLFVFALSGQFVSAQPSAAIPLPNQSHVHAPDSTTDNGLKPVQVFDVSQGKVVKSVPNDKAFQKMSKKWLKSVTGLAPQLTADNSCTFVYRIPQAKPAVVETGSISISTSDLFLFYCQDKPPLLLVFDANRKPYLLLFKEDIKPFIRKVGVPTLND